VFVIATKNETTMFYHRIFFVVRSVRNTEIE
jgi:hypothetical protein